MFNPLGSNSGGFGAPSRGSSQAPTFASSIPGYTTGGNEPARWIPTFTLPSDPSLSSTNAPSGTAATQPPQVATTTYPQGSRIPSWSGLAPAAAATSIPTTAPEVHHPAPSGASFSMGVTPKRGNHRSGRGQDSRHPNHDLHASPEVSAQSPAASSLFPDAVAHVQAPMFAAAAATPPFAGSFKSEGPTRSQFEATTPVQRNLYDSYVSDTGHPAAAASPKPATSKSTPGERR